MTWITITASCLPVVILAASAAVRDGGDSPLDHRITACAVLASAILALSLHAERLRSTLRQGRRPQRSVVTYLLVVPLSMLIWVTVPVWSQLW